MYMHLITCIYVCICVYIALNKPFFKKSYDIEYKLNQDLLNLKTWSKIWLLSFSPSKTKEIYVSTRKTVDTPILKFQNCQLDFVSSQKHLGLTFSDDLIWTVYSNC